MVDPQEFETDPRFLSDCTRISGDLSGWIEGYKQRIDELSRSNDLTTLKTRKLAKENPLGIDGLLQEGALILAVARVIATEKRELQIQIDELTQKNQNRAS